MFGFLKGRLLSVRLLLSACAAALVAIGVFMIFASGNPMHSDDAFSEIAGLWKRQLIYAAAGLVGFLIINSVHYRKLGSWSLGLYIGVILLLALLPLDKFLNIPFVPVKHGARRWIQIGTLLQFQPSEFFKLAYIIALAWYLRYRSNYRRFSALVGPFVLTLIPMLLILLEPDLGTVMLMMPVLLAMLFIAGAKVKHLTLIVLMAILASPLLWWQMHDYQRMRISSVLLQKKLNGQPGWFRTKIEQHPRLAAILGLDPAKLRNWEIGQGYQLTRSKLAIASGGPTGQGYRQGPFVKYKFLPDRHNDFIFALIAHQWGFAGCILVLALYALWIVCGMEIASANTDPFGRFIAAGIVVMFAIQVLVNVSMTIGLMPITGITLPFISYGGSSLMVSIMATGLLNNVGRHRPFNLSASAG